MASTVDEILQNSRKPKPVDIPGWGATIKIRKMNGDDRDAFNAAIMSGEADEQPQHFRAEFIRRCTVEPEFDSVDQVLEAADDGIFEAFAAIKEHSNLERSVDEAEKNFEKTKGEDSSSG